VDIVAECSDVLLKNVLFGATLGVLMSPMQRNDLGHWTYWKILTGEEGQDESEDSFRKKKELK